MKGIFFEVRDLFRTNKDIHQPAQLIIDLAKANGYQLLGKPHVLPHPLGPWEVQLMLRNTKLSDICIALDDFGVVTSAWGKSIKADTRVVFVNDEDDCEVLSTPAEVDKFLTGFAHWC
jgi:hypothetical protein